MTKFKYYITFLIVMMGLSLIMLLLTYIPIPFTTWDSFYRAFLALIFTEWLLEEKK